MYYSFRQHGSRTVIFSWAGVVGADIARGKMLRKGNLNGSRPSVSQNKTHCN